MPSKQIFELERSSFNVFLFAEIGQEANGMPLTVLSGIARLGTDPWTEAARLGGLSTQAAIEALARIIANLPFPRYSSGEASAIATRLIALLPAAGPRRDWRRQGAHALVGALIAISVLCVAESLPLKPAQPPVVSSTGQGR